LREQWEDLHRQPDRYKEIKLNELDPARNLFLKHVWRYNAEMSFGTLVIEKVNLNLSIHIFI